MTLILIPLGILLSINVLTFAAFGVDKSSAVRQEYRLPEAYLLKLSFLGGWFGAKFAQRYFRHKTFKQPFGRRLNCVPILWCIIVMLVIAVPKLPDDLLGGFEQENKRQTPKFFKSVQK